MERFIQLVIDGIAIGSIYGALALALVLIFRSTGIVNFAQGEMAMFSTFIAWGLVEAGLPLGLALLGALALSFLGGMAIERILIRPVENADPLTILIVTLGLFILINSAAGWIWGFENRGFPRALPDGSADIAGINISYESLGIVAVLLDRQRAARAALPAHQARAGDARGGRQPGLERGSSGSASGAR